MKRILIFLALCVPTFGQSPSPQVENRTSIEILEVSSSSRFTVLHLKNTGMVSIVGIAITRGPTDISEEDAANNPEARLSIEEDLAFQPSQKILPGQAFDFQTATTEDPIVISAVLFEDCTGSGNQRLRNTMLARLSGAEEASRYVLRALSEEPTKDSLLAVVVSLSEPSKPPTGNWTDHAYRAGFLTIKQRALREVKKLHEGQALTEGSPGADTKVYFENVLKVRRAN